MSYKLSRLTPVTHFLQQGSTSQSCHDLPKQLQDLEFNKHTSLRRTFHLQITADVKQSKKLRKRNQR